MKKTLFLAAALTGAAVAANNDQLLGEWTSGGLTSSINYVNKVTGAYAPPSGAIANYKFLADGTYEETGLLQSTAYNCTTKLWFERRGRYAFAGSQLVLEEASSKMRSEDNCRKQWNYEKQNDLKRSVFEWRMEMQDGSPRLVVKGPGGQPVIYRRKP